METLVVGDLHLKQPVVLPRVDSLLAAHPAVGRVVFLGDACDTMSLFSSGAPIGDGLMLLVDENYQVSKIPFPGGEQEFRDAMNEYLTS